MAVVLGGNCPGGSCPGWQLSQVAVVLQKVAVVRIPTIGEDLKTDSFPVFESSRFITTER